MPTLNPYLNFPGNTEDAFNFYKSVFGGEFPAVMRWKDIPKEMQGAGEMKEGQGEKIMHIALRVGKNNMLMATDSLDGKLVAGNNFTISITPDSKEEADKLFVGLSAGGKVTMPMDNAFWGDYFGMLKDKFGIAWMISFRPAQG